MNTNVNMSIWQNNWLSDQPLLPPPYFDKKKLPEIWEITARTARNFAKILRQCQGFDCKEAIRSFKQEKLINCRVDRVLKEWEIIEADEYFCHLVIKMWLTHAFFDHLRKFKKQI